MKKRILVAMFLSVAVGAAALVVSLVGLGAQLPVSRAHSLSWDAATARVNGIKIASAETARRGDLITYTIIMYNSDPNEAPAQEMELPAFMMDAFEVTNADYATFAEATGFVTFREQEESPQNWRAAYTEAKENHPVVFVTLNDAQSFCDWAGKRLPTELEWEKAARGPDGYLYPWGNQYDASLLNGKDSGLRGTTAVGSYPPNGYGLFDMAGNVKEWVDSSYIAYPGSDYQDSHYNPDFRGIRGGGWFDEAEYVLSTNRNGGDPQITANDDIGFRCAK
jgi:formylglycine-generating enzyme required for sulfatase activity